MYISLFWKRPFIWLSRFRHRCGYGVHSPFAFDFITNVVYEKTPYYAYRPLAEEEKKLPAARRRRGAGESLKVKRLLFRLVNRTQPAFIVDAGVASASSLYLQAARPGAEYVEATDLSELFLEQGMPVDFLYLHDFRNPEFVEQVFRVCLPRTTSQSVFVIEGIAYNAPMRQLWKRMQAEEKVGITFDLYDVGVLFFDRMKIKQHYVVNF